MKKEIVVYSGGLDSTVLLAMVHASNHAVTALHFCYGQKHSQEETQAALTVCTHFNVSMKIIELAFPAWGFKSELLAAQGDIPAREYNEEDLKKTVVPFRNGIMLSIAAGIAASCGVKTVYIGAHTDDHAVYPDCRPGFLYNMHTAIEYGTDMQVGLAFPFCEKTKADIVKLGAELGAPMDLSYSCYNGGEIHCGVCSTCRARKEAFISVGFPDMTEYKE
ncbi:hypothetical protein LCGC14_0752870 [marine sediment metagenome]|uniref:7-cyano-7-deazaguanine synthase n=1 Tax=marine sediment metagenome TaxID=412755 RepID=A0A0F9TAG8_9ZZZZ